MAISAFVMYAVQCAKSTYSIYYRVSSIERVYNADLNDQIFFDVEGITKNCQQELSRHTSSSFNQPLSSSIDDCLTLKGQCVQYL
jgi:hypothetical protein